MSKMRTYSRRKRALILLALLVVILPLSAAVMVGTGVYCLPPEQALHKIEYSSGVENLEIIHVEDAVDNPKGNLKLQICRSGDYFVFTDMRWSLRRGWSISHYAIIEAYDPEERDFVWACNTKEDTEAWLCLFGFVPDGEQPPTFRAGIFNENVQQQDGADRVLDPVTYDPVATIPVEGGKLFLGQYIYTAPHPAEYYEQEYVGVSFDVCYNGVWDYPGNWMQSGA